VSAGPVIVINVSARLFIAAKFQSAMTHVTVPLYNASLFQSFDDVLLRGGEWHCGMGEATLAWCQAFIVALAQVNEEGCQAEGEEEQGLEAAPGRAEAGPGQEAEEVCCDSAGSVFETCLSQHDIPDRSHHLHFS